MYVESKLIIYYTNYMIAQRCTYIHAYVHIYILGWVFKFICKFFGNIDRKLSFDLKVMNTFYFFILKSLTTHSFLFYVLMAIDYRIPLSNNVINLVAMATIA